MCQLNTILRNASDYTCNNRSSRRAKTFLRAIHYSSDQCKPDSVWGGIGVGMRREWTGLTSKSLEKPHPSVSRWGRKNFSHEVWRYQSSDYRETRKRRGANTGGSNQWLLNDGNASVTVMPWLRHCQVDRWAPNTWLSNCTCSLSLASVTGAMSPGTKNIHKNIELNPPTAI